MEASGGSPIWQSFFQVDIGKEEMGVAQEGGSGGQSLPTGACLWCEVGADLMVASIKLLGAHPQGPVLP